MMKNKKIILFLDDSRNANDYVDTYNNIVKQSFTYNEFINDVQDYFFLYGCIDEIWFDHDLGDKDGNGYDCAKYLVKFCDNNGYKLPEWHIQSANPVGKDNIDSYLKSYLKSLENEE